MMRYICFHFKFCSGKVFGPGALSVLSFMELSVLSFMGDLMLHKLGMSEK
jgi:hypothetical protein